MNITLRKAFIKDSEITLTCKNEPSRLKKVSFVIKTKEVVNLDG